MSVQAGQAAGRKNGEGQRGRFANHTEILSMSVTWERHSLAHQAAKNQGRWEDPESQGAWGQQGSPTSQAGCTQQDLGSHRDTSQTPASGPGM